MCQIKGGKPPYRLILSHHDNVRSVSLPGRFDSLTRLCRETKGQVRTAGQRDKLGVAEGQLRYSDCKHSGTCNSNSRVLSSEWRDGIAFYAPLDESCPTSCCASLTIMLA